MDHKDTGYGLQEVSKPKATAEFSLLEVVLKAEGFLP